MSPTDASPLLTPDDYRRRYFELKRRAAENATARPARRHTPNPAIIPADAVIAAETIPAGWYWTAKLARGASLRILNESGTPGVSALLWNAADTAERYNAGDTVKVQWTARLTRGQLLLSDMGRVLASITDDTSGWHDSILGGSVRPREPGNPNDPAHRSTQENFLLAAGKLGLGLRDVGPCITFFAPVATDEAGRFVWQDGAIKPGDYVDLRAEMDLLVALSNCPHPLAPHGVASGAVRAVLWNSPPPEADDLCRSASDEAVRAFENTDAARDC